MSLITAPSGWLDSTAVRVLVFHGYLLRGTGSNIYNAELAETLVRMGHEVHLLCQEHDPGGLGFVDSIGDWEKGELVVRTVAKRAQEGACTVYRPDIGGLLPVYVYDRYERFEVRTFDRLTDAELENYIDANVAAVRDVADAFDPDVALANHLVMGPVILARALEDVPYAVKIHGSALEDTVKPHYQRFSPYAREGLAKARAVLVGSQHTAESLWAAMASEDLPQRTRLGPPGVDTPRARIAVTSARPECAAEIGSEPQAAASAATIPNASGNMLGIRTHSDTGIRRASSPCSSRPVNTTVSCLRRAAAK